MRYDPLTAIPVVQGYAAELAMGYQRQGKNAAPQLEATFAKQLQGIVIPLSAAPYGRPPDKEYIETAIAYVREQSGLW
jgi:hypothetical protein